jgi:aminoglycoside 6-adenylyltransferase
MSVAATDVATQRPDTGVPGGKLGRFYPSTLVLSLPEEADVLGRLVAWGEAQAPVRAMILTSARARADARVDALSDYDVILFVSKTENFSRSDVWQSAYGQPSARWGDEDELYGLRIYFRGVVYGNGTKIDYSIWPDALLELISTQPTLPDRLDVGYRVLLDKDERTAGWRPPTYRAHIPTRPTQAEYEALVSEFWWDTTYVAKGLWRGEVIFAKFALDHDAKFGALRRFLEWLIELDHDWSLRPGAYGRGLERLLPDDVWSELSSTYVGADIEDNWNALFRTAALFRKVATEVGDALGYTYPQEIDDAVTTHLNDVRELVNEG